MIVENDIVFKYEETKFLKKFRKYFKCLNIEFNT